jgi:hypothetical protein
METAELVTRVSHKLSFAALTLLLLAITTACGGGGSSNGSPPPPPTPPPLAISSSQNLLPQGLVGQPYSGKLQATGGVPPYHWSTTLLGIDGLNLATDGTISGTPNRSGTFIPTFTVTDSVNRSVTGGIEIDVFSQLVFATSSTLPAQNVALPVYSYITANGGKPPYSFNLAAGTSVPPGLTFANSGGAGLIQGTPTTPGSYSFTVEVTDTFAPPLKISQLFTMSVRNDLLLPQTSLPDAVQNLSYQEQIQPVGGTPPYHFVLSQGSVMPPGLKLDSSTGKVTGTPTTITNDWILVVITDSAPTPATINPLIALNVQPPLSIQTTSLPDDARGLNYFGALNIAGGRAPYTAQIVSGALPDGVTLSPSPYPSMFNLNGVLAKDGVFSFAVQVSDSYEVANTVQQKYQVRVSDQMNMTGPGQAQILYNQTYNTTFPITGGFPPYKWTMDVVPPGFTFDSSTGTFNGTPTAGGSTTSIINAQDSSNPPLHANYLVFSVNVYDKLRVQTSSLPPIAAGSAVWLGLQGAGGAAPYSWNISSGSLPAGTAFNSGTG